MQAQFIFFLRLGGSYLAMFIFPAIVFMVWRFFSSFFSEPRITFQRHARIIGRFALILIGAALLLSLTLYLSAALAGLPPAQLAAASDWCAKIDRTLFGVDVPFWFQRDGSVIKSVMDRLGFILIWSYVSLTSLMAFALNITLALRFQTFLRLSTALIAAIILSLPIWYRCPALIPAERYLDNILAIDSPSFIAPSLAAYTPNTKLTNFQARMRATRIGPTQGVTTMPSMHVAWALIIAFFLFQIAPKTAWVTLPYNVFNAIAAIYTLEHYAIDIFAGLIIGIISIFLAQRWIHSATDQPQITDLIQESARPLLVRFDQYASRFKQRFLIFKR